MFRTTNACLLTAALLVALSSCGRVSTTAKSDQPEQRAASVPPEHGPNSSTYADDFEAMIELLGDRQLQARQNAQAKLIAMGMSIRPRLHAKIQDKTIDPEVRARLTLVLESLITCMPWPFDCNEAVRRQDEEAKYLGISKELEISIGNNVTMKLVLIPAGKFMMGSPIDEKGREGVEENRGEETLHEVTISKPFYLGIYHVTQEQYELVMGKNPSRFKGKSNPVEMVSWDDATEFCKSLSGKIGRAVGLPTEAQWEFACRAGTSTPFNTGNTISTEQANYDGSKVYGDGKEGVNRDKPTPVGTFKPNAWGLYDMHGNISQWCSDWYSASYYADSPKIDPAGPPVTSRRTRVLRGGSWSYDPKYCRSAGRWADAPDYHSGYGVGFRVVVTIDK
jgi:formylglycine-generating enzyme required for sulfatase activity